jgi:hypothetical protein
MTGRLDRSSRRRASSRPIAGRLPITRGLRTSERDRTAGSSFAISQLAGPMNCRIRHRYVRRRRAYLGYNSAPRLASTRAMVRRSGHDSPARTRRSVPSSTPAARATERTLRSPIAAPRLRASWRATSPAESSETADGQDSVSSRGFDLDVRLTSDPPAARTRRFQTPHGSTTPHRVKNSEPGQLRCIRGSNTVTPHNV